MAAPRGMISQHIATEKEINRILREAGKEAAARVRSLGARGTFGSQVRAAQLSAVHSVIDEAFISIGKEVADRKEQVARIASELSNTGIGTALREAGYTEQQVMAYLRGSVASAQANVERAVMRMNNFRYEYSERVYRSDVLAKGWLDNAVNKGIAQGQSADELAKTVQKWVSPNTPGGANYAAKRLARTEINAAFHASSAAKYQGQPWVFGTKWNLSGSHSRTDECDDLAEDAHMVGGEPGVFAPEDVPAQPHPNCLCFITPEVESDEVFSQRLLNGDYDTYVRQNIMLGGV